MKRINKIIILFFVISFVTIYAGWVFIHSRQFSEHASKYVSNLLTKKMGAKLNFEGVEFSMFPPATIFKKVELIKSQEGKFSAGIKLNEFGVLFTYASFFSSNLEIDQLVLKDGSIDVDIIHDDKSPDIDWKNLKIAELFDLYSKYYSASPVKLNFLKLENITSKVDKANFKLNNLILMPHKKNIRLKIEAENIELGYELNNYNLPNINKVSIQFNSDKKELLLENAAISVGSNSLGLSGKLSQDKKSNLIDLNSKVSLDLNTLNKYFKKPISDLQKSSALIESNLKIKGDLLNPDVDVDLNASSVFTPYINLDKVHTKVLKRRNIIAVEKLSAKNKNESYSLEKATNLFDLNKMFFLKTHGVFEVKDAFTNTFLYAIRDSLDVVKGYVTGKIDIAFDGDRVFFAINDKATLKNFKLVFPKSKKPLLENKGFDLEKTLITLDSKNNVGIDAKITMSDSSLKINGVIEPKSINVIVSDSKINLNSFGPISGIKINGSGPVDIKISGPMEDVRFDFNVFWKQFGLLDLNFGDVKSHFVLSLADVMLSIESLRGKFNNSEFDASGWLQFSDKSGLDLKLNFPETSFADAKQMYGLVFKGLKLPSDLAMKFSANYRIFGDFDLEKLKVDGQLKGKEFHVFGEDADQVSFGFLLDNNNLQFKNLKLKKSRGEIIGYANISLSSNFSEVGASGTGLRLSDFNFYKKLNLAYDSDLALEYDGNGTPETYSSRLKFKTIDPFIGNFPASNSNGLIYLNHDELIAKVGLLGSKVKVDSIYDFKNNQVTLKTNIDTQDLRELFGSVSAHNLNDKKITGNVKANLNAKFNANTLAISKFILDVKQLRLKREEVDLRIDPNHNTINVENGIVNKWDLMLVDGKEFFQSKGKNINEGRSIVCDQVFNVKASILELVNGMIEKSKGIIKGYNQIQIDKIVQFNSFRISSNDSSLKFKKIPGVVSNLNYEIVKNVNRFDVSKITGKYGEGDFKAIGFLVFDNMYPTVNIEFKLDNAIIPLFKKSNVVMSANGVLTGTDLPYNLTAKASFARGEFLDDVSEIMGDRNLSLDEFNKYLPNRNENILGYVNLNVNFDTQNFITVKNNMSEIYLKANGQVTGDILNPEINTRIEVQPTTSKFKFKGHDFLLSQGYLEIHDKAKVRNSELKFIGLTKVNDYEIKLDLSGKLDKVAINLSSEPVKSQEDIISLLALGVTSDMNKNLDPAERSSIARLGIGTMFLDQLKVNEDLNSTIGVNLSVLPEFQEDESSLISGGKSAVGDTSSSKLKSATKIKINKKLTNKVDVSVSSTVGGSIEQKQEMNINWSVDKNISVEGVYEMKSTEEDNTNTPNSMGADLKFKWSF